MSMVEKTGTCWNWTGQTAGSKTRYGYFRPGTRQTDRRVPAHRFSYEHHVGPIPEGYEIDHLCKNRLCVNPAHLEPVPPAENMRRERLLECPQGHDLTIDTNCQWDAQGRRRGCLICHRERARAYAARKYAEKKGK